MMQSIQSYTMIQEAGLTPSCQQVSLKDGGHDMIWTKDASGHFCTIHWHHNNAVIHCCLIWTQIRPILLAACHTLDEQVMSGYPRSETSRIKQHPVILTVVLGLLKMKMIFIILHMARQRQFLRPSIFSLAAGTQWDFTLREAVWLEERVGRSTNHFGGRWPIIQFFSVFQTSISRLITSGITFEQRQRLLNDLRAHSGVFGG